MKLNACLLACFLASDALHFQPGPHGIPRQDSSQGGPCLQEMMRGEAQELVKASFGPTLLCTIGKVYESQAQVGTHQQGQYEKSGK